RTPTESRSSGTSGASRASSGRDPSRWSVISTVEATTRLVAVRAEPDDDAEQVTQALPGEPLSVEDRREGRARIRTAYDYPGWLRAETLDGVTDEDWLVVCLGDPVEEARSYLGAPYEWGGLTEKGIDCSGLVHMAYRRLGRLVPRDADQQEAA